MWHWSAQDGHLTRVLRLIVDSDFLLSLLILMLNIAAEWKSSAQPYLSERNKGKRVPEAAGLSFQWLVRELWCQNSTVPLPQAGASPMALGGSTGDKLVSFQTEIWVHMTWASSCHRRGAPCTAHAQPMHRLCVRTPWFQEADTKKCWIYKLAKLCKCTHDIKQYLEMCHDASSRPWFDILILLRLTISSN